MAADGVVDELPTGGRKGRKRKKDETQDEFSSLTVDSEQAAALDEQVSSEVVFTGEVESIDAPDEDEVGLSA